jgi:hypothetical protein
MATVEQRSDRRRCSAEESDGTDSVVVERKDTPKIKRQQQSDQRKQANTLQVWVCDDVPNRGPAGSTKLAANGGARHTPSPFSRD